MCLFGAQERDRGLETEHSANIHEVLAIFLVWSLSLWCSQCACMHVCASADGDAGMDNPI